MGTLLLRAIIGAGDVRSSGSSCGGTAFVFSDGESSPGCAMDRYTRLGVALMIIGWGGVAAIAMIVVAAMPDQPKVVKTYAAVAPDRTDPR